MNKKIALVSVSPRVGSGYGEGSLNLIDIFTKLGYEVCMLSLYGNQGYTDAIEVNDKIIKIYPVNQNLKNEKLVNIFDVYNLEQFDLVWGFYDLFAFGTDKYMQQHYFINSLMVDSEPFIPSNYPAYKGINCALFMSNAAKDSVSKLDINKDKLLEYLPIPINDEDFYIEEDINRCKKDIYRHLGIKCEVRRLISVVAANATDGGLERKNFYELLKWWGKHTEEEPNDYLYLHTDISGYGQLGSNIKLLTKNLGINTKRIRFANNLNYSFGLYDREYMRLLYNSSDVMLVPSHSEGEGMPYIEASLCGCVCVGNNFQSGGEVIKNCKGELIECRPNYYVQGAIKSKSYAEDIDKAMKLALKRDRSIESRIDIRLAALEHYSTTALLPKYDELLQKAFKHKQELEEQIPIISDNSEYDIKLGQKSEYK